MRTSVLASLAWVGATLLVAAALVHPMSAVKRSRAVDSTLDGMRRAHKALAVYMADNGSGPEDWRALPPVAAVYAGRAGVDTKDLSGQCGRPPLAYDNMRGATVQMVAPADARTRAYFDRYGSGSMVLIDGSCNDDPRLWASRIARKLGLGVRLDGRAVKKVKAGDGTRLEWWHEADWIRTTTSK